MNWLINWLNNKLKIQNILIKEKKEMNSKEIKELTERIKGMSREELEVVAGVIPVDLCLERINAELKKAKELEDSIKNMAGLLGK